MKHTSDDGAALLRAICDHPDEDTPRLVYADWLDEQGGESNAARAEFIRIQIAEAKKVRQRNISSIGLRHSFQYTDREHELIRLYTPKVMRTAGATTCRSTKTSGTGTTIRPNDSSAGSGGKSKRPM